ncbi:MAG: PKD domain-containing protein, partial [Actinobacteria bacterium ATB1]|nr:PKD domain-containing protein [Actinobacteria bacterium ATB1]
SPAGSGVSPSHTYVAAGSYTATLTVTDDDGATDTDTVGISVSPSGAADVVTLNLTGGVQYANSGALTSGNVTVGPTSMFGAVSSVTGVGQLPGLNSGTATVSFNVKSFIGLPVYLGNVVVSDPSAGVSVNTFVLFGSIQKSGNTVSSSSSWFLTSSWPWVGYNLSWSVQDNV